MAQEITVAAVSAKANEMLFDPVAKALEVASSTVQVNTKLLQDVVELGKANLQAGRKYVETIQQASWDGGYALLELSASTTRAALQWTESLQASLRG